MSDPQKQATTGSPLRIPATWFNDVTNLLKPRARPPSVAGDASPSRLLIPMRITAVDDVTAEKRYEYTLDEVVAVANVAGQDMYEPKSGGIVGATGYNIGEERNDQGGDDEESLPVGRVVHCWREHVSGKVEFRFDAGRSATLPVPQYQGMVLQAVTDETLGADWVRATEVIE